MIKDWNDVTLKQFKQVKNLKPDDLEDQIRLGEIILGINADDLTFAEYGRKLKELDFMSNPVPKTIIRKTYTLNGRVYECKSRLDQLSVSQFMDFTEFSKNRDDLEKILAVFLIPEGKKYGEGYDVQQVFGDILDMSIVDVLAISNFFFLQFKACVTTIQNYSTGAVKKMKKGDRKVIRQALELLNTEFFYMLEDL